MRIENVRLCRVENSCHLRFEADEENKPRGQRGASASRGGLGTPGEKSGAPAWKEIPSWYLVGTEDRAIAPATQMFMAERAHSHTVEIDASHASLVSHPDAVAKLILTAVHSVG